MDCRKVETLISNFIENDLNEGQREEISRHLKKCKNCRKLKEKLETLIPLCPELQEEVPFFLKNRLYNIFEATEDRETRYGYLRWVAAAIGTLILFLNLFYFTNIFPAANKTLHVATARVERFLIETKAFIEEFKATGDQALFGFFEEDRDVENGNQPSDPSKKGGKNG